MRRARALACISIGAAVVAAHSLSAQTVHGSVRDAVSGATVPGAIVTLVAGDDRYLSPVLTDTDGSYRITAPVSGSYRLRVDLVGYESWSSPALALGVGDTTSFDVRLPLRRVRLDALVVTGESHCTQNPQDAPRTLDTWEEIRRALTGSAISQHERGLPFELRLTQRLMTGRCEVAGSRQETRLRGLALRPWDALPPGELAKRGYVQQAGDSLLWYGPGVETLLSEEFLSTHCFQAARDGDRVGLAFTPLPDRTLPDVAGTIWLDGRTSELRTVDFTFQHAADSLGNGKPAGGSLQFARLPYGRWYISRWRLQVPISALSVGDPDDPNVRWERRRRRRARTLIDEVFRESAGDAVALSPDGRAGTRASALVTGVVIDSTMGEALGGVHVLAVGAEPVVTDSTGRYVLEITDAPADETIYALTFVHPRLSVLGLRSTERMAVVRAGTTVTLDFAVPSVATLLQGACPLNGEQPTDASGRLRVGMLLGDVVAADGSLPPAGAEVVAEWPSEGAVADSASGGRVMQLRSVALRPDGGFHLCPLPLAREVTLEVRRDGQVLASAPLVVPANGLARYTLVLKPHEER